MPLPDLPEPTLDGPAAVLFRQARSLVRASVLALPARNAENVLSIARQAISNRHARADALSRLPSLPADALPGALGTIDRLGYVADTYRDAYLLAVGALPAMVGSRDAWVLTSWAVNAADSLKGEA